ncbi:MAG: hypothetical protein H5T45_06165 [Thermoplasmatales archaeon]|nr:hypothetical protein [Thermoplasmatales archaeon]
MNEKEIFIEFYKRGLIKTWKKDNPKGWKLLSGMWSPFYVQFRNLPSHPDLLDHSARLLAEKIKGKGNKLLGIAMAGIPIATAVSLHSMLPMCYTRKNSASYGEHSLIEGEIKDGDNFIAIDDVVTKFDSKLNAIKQLDEEAKRRNCSVKCENVAVIIDRQQGAEEAASKHGVKIYSIIKFRDNIEWLRDEMGREEYEVIVDYLGNPEKYQDEERRRYLLKN